MFALLMISESFQVKKNRKISLSLSLPLIFGKVQI